MEDVNINQPMTDEIYKDPSNPQTQLILRLYSMEPPFYSYLNNACREMDMQKIETLGPFAKAIFKVLGCGKYSDERREDAIEQGVQFTFHKIGSMCRSFLLFRGALMYKEWIEGWRENVGKRD